MRPDENGAERIEADVPSMLDLIRLSRRPLFPPGGVELCRQIALLTEMKAGDEVLVVPAGLAVTLEYYVAEHGVVGSGVESDPTVIERAEERLRSRGMLERVHIQPGQMDGLPFRDGIFDVVVAELGLTSRKRPHERWSGSPNPAAAWWSFSPCGRRPWTPSGARFSPSTLGVAPSWSSNGSDC